MVAVEAGVIYNAAVVGRVDTTPSMIGRSPLVRSEGLLEVELLPPYEW